MPKKTRHKHEPEFYETLSPSLPYGGMASSSAIDGTPLWVYPAWIAGSIVLGVLLGLAIKDFQTVKHTLARPGIVAKINDPQYSVAASGLAVSQTQSQAIQGNYSTIQGSASSLQSGRNITSYQNGFSGYGQQGSVGTSAARQ